ncbi:MAG: TRAP transporter small permease [Rhodospirillales bacterium]|nr:TRAP transporter small permease [Rhodospirillales bacterium]
MRPPDTENAKPNRFGRVLYRVSVAVAGFGGVAMLAMTVLTIASIVGREVVSMPIPGDFELVEIGCAIAIFAFLPYCQLVRGNVIVDLFTDWASMRTRALLELVSNLAFSLVAAVLTWRTALGAIDIWTYREETMVLRVPLWWGFDAGVYGFGFLTGV